MSSGVASARKSSTPASAAIAWAVSALSPVIITVRMPIARSSANRSRHALLDDVLEVDDAEHRAGARLRRSDDERRAAAGAISSTTSRTSSGAWPPDAEPGGDGRAGALADLGAVGQVDAGHPRLGGELDEPHRRAAGEGRGRRRPARGRGRRSSGPRASGRRGRRGRAGSSSRPRRDGHDAAGLTVAVGDGAGLVEQQRADVAGGLDGTARHREHVDPHEAVHAGDADRRQQGADGGRDEADQQRDEHDDVRRGAGVRRHRREGATAARKTSVRLASRIDRAISLGVLRREVPSTSAIILSRKVSPAPR